ncbi:ABC-type sugar transport system, permease component [Paenibacillus uliginis N3/975]|uniref:ABC-type sugar transport system, permease component n=1 Tax=Paenibacillus uliginis N3/975 TaxID=1313296 RepID=A0A1X7H720_9BACL|nr:sugar ABC transporter permease [Paenibacillus uliginis]SMF80640.1 ABC-type sugar transport system, permease component [Paenibacillus uliginis N3/975]
MASKRKMSLERKKAWFGVLFITPWLLGFILLMAVPFIQSLQFSFHKLSLTSEGYDLQYVGLDNFKHILFVDAWYVRNLTEAVTTMALNVPLIIFFSLFTATLLSQKFRGRMLARAIIFLPVVLASGVIAKLDNGNFLAQVMGTSSTDLESNYSGLRSLELRPLLLQAGLSFDVVNYLTGAVDRIYQIISSSGVQILIFLAGLQSVSSSLYEAAKMEGATGYEAFWKITFPMISPLILTNVVYTIIDSFYNNRMTEMIQSTAFGGLNFGVSAAMSWIYFLVISIILVISTYFISKKVFYHD